MQDTWTIGNNKVNEFTLPVCAPRPVLFLQHDDSGWLRPRSQYSWLRLFRPRALLLHSAHRAALSSSPTTSPGRLAATTRSSAWTSTTFRPDATFTVNYGGVYDFGTFSSANLGFISPVANDPFPDLSAVQAYGAGLPGDFIQGIRQSPATRSPTNRWECFGRIPGGRVRTSPSTMASATTSSFRRSSKRRPCTGACRIQRAGIAEGDSDRHAQYPAARRRGLGSKRRRQDCGSRLLRHLLRSPAARPLLPRRCFRWFHQRTASFRWTGGCSIPACAAPPSFGNLNAIPIFQGLPHQLNSAGPCAVLQSIQRSSARCGYLPNQQQFRSLNFPQSMFLNQNYLNPTTFCRWPSSLLAIRRRKNFVYAYSQQANFTVESDLGDGFAFNLAYNFNGGRHFNRPINANTVRGDLLVENLNAAVAGGVNLPTDNPLRCNWLRRGFGRSLRPGSPHEFLPSVRSQSLHRPGVVIESRDRALCPGGIALVQQEYGLNTSCNLRHARQLRSLRRHGRQLLQRQFRLSRPQRQSAQALQPPLRIPCVLHLVARH